ncbi:MAG: hypothetical protein LC100_09870 [Chitinophagales bacterium]|nr:hypothetical protein [Chitinophagales bacterium]
MIVLNTVVVSDTLYLDSNKTLHSPINSHVVQLSFAVSTESADLSHNKVVFLGYMD